MFLALTVPFLGTMIGAGAVLGLPLGSQRVQSGLSGFVAGAMLGAAFWNLLVPGAQVSAMGASVGFLLGLGLISVLEYWGCAGTDRYGSVGILMLALVLHNIPEGLAVGIAGGEHSGTMIGIALQNIPDGAVAAMPLAAMGKKKRSAFALGTLSGAVEPVAALAAMQMQALSPHPAAGMMGFAAGAMLYVVIRELIPRMDEDLSSMGTFAAGMLLILGMSGVT